MTPAEHVIKKCGGVAVVAQICGRSESAVYRWTHEKNRGGTGGLVPSGAQAKLLKAATEGRVSLVPDDFFPAPQRVTHGDAA